MMNKMHEDALRKKQQATQNKKTTGSRTEDRFKSANDNKSTQPRE